MTSKAHAFVSACLMLVLWTTPVWSSSKKHKSTTPTPDVTETTADDSTEKSTTSVSGIDVSHPYLRMLCGLSCDSDTPDAGPSNFRARFVFPFIPLPIYFTGRFALHSYEGGPTWASQYSAPDWTAAAGLEMPLAPGTSLWAEVGRATSMDTMGCAGSCLISSQSASNYGMDIVRIGFVMRN